MKRNIVKIDSELCNGCGACADACHEGAIQMIDGKAQLISESYCDGLGACLPHCPTGAITIEERDADVFDEAAVAAKTAAQPEIKPVAAHPMPMPAKLACGCPGTHAKEIKREPAHTAISHEAAPIESQLRQWPVQIKLVPPNAPYFDGAHLLVAADCTAYAYANIHNDFMKNKITIIGCPKLDEGDYADKLTQIIKNNNIKSVTALRMEVPCCGGIVNAVKTALINSGKMLPWSAVTISTDGEVLED